MNRSSDPTNSDSVHNLSAPLAELGASELLSRRAICARRLDGLVMTTLVII
jgi:hypothetical protein